MGARTELVLTLLACITMYHQFVRRLKTWQLLSIGLSLFAGFLAIGLVRGSATLGSNLANFKSGFATLRLGASTNTEFQALFAGNFDLLRVKEEGNLGQVPLQFMLYDIVMVVPQQLLPFPKLDVQEWVYERSLPGFFMFNPISQAIIGFGWLEVIARGVMLGFVLTKVRIWYARRSQRFWPTLGYFYLIMIAYYTFRGTAFYIIIVCILFRFLPLYLLFCVLRHCQPHLPILQPRPFPMDGSAGR